MGKYDVDNEESRHARRPYDRPVTRSERRRLNQGPPKVDHAAAVKPTSKRYGLATPRYNPRDLKKELFPALKKENGGEPDTPNLGCKPLNSDMFRDDRRDDDKGPGLGGGARRQLFKMR